MPAFCGKNLEYLAFMIDGAPEIMRFTVDPHKHFVEMPSPLRIQSMMNALFPDLRGEHRTEPVPLESHSFVADINATLKQQIFDLPQRKRITDVYHPCEADYFGRTVEITEGILHRRRLRNAAPRLKPI